MDALSYSLRNAILYIAPAGCVALIRFIIRINANVFNGHFAAEFDVNKVRLRAIGLPVGVQGAVSQLLHAEACNSSRMDE